MRAAEERYQLDGMREPANTVPSPSWCRPDPRRTPPRSTPADYHPSQERAPFPPFARLGDRFLCSPLIALPPFFDHGQAFLETVPALLEHRSEESFADYRQALRDIINENRSLHQRVSMLESARLPWRYGARAPASSRSRAAFSAAAFSASSFSHFVAK